MQHTSSFIPQNFHNIGLKMKKFLLDVPEGWRQLENFGQTAGVLIHGEAAMK